jgi:hypothetical protein
MRFFLAIFLLVLSFGEPVSAQQRLTYGQRSLFSGAPVRYGPPLGWENRTARPMPQSTPMLTDRQASQRRPMCVDQGPGPYGRRVICY